MSMRYYISTEEASFFINNRMGYANSIPTSGNYKVGDFIISSTQEDGIFGWVCTVAGTPGEWEVIGSGMGNSGSGMHNKVVGYINAVSFSDARSSIEIGINEYVKSKDFLEVHYNGLMLAEGVHYNVSEDGKSIIALDEVWNENADDTQQMIFRVIKSEGVNVKELKNTININSACYEVEMGIEGFSPEKDVVEVHLNGVLLVQGVDYEIVEGRISKKDRSEAWNPYNVNGQKMFVRVFRNIANLVEPSDGSVTVEKLAPELASDIAAIDGLLSSMSIQNSTISNLNDRVAAIEEKIESGDIVTNGGGGGGPVKLTYKDNLVEVINTNTVAIGLPFNKEKNMLEVHIDGLKLAEGIHYNISEDGTSIVKVEGVWNPDSLEDQYIDFRVISAGNEQIEHLTRNVEFSSPMTEVGIELEYEHGVDILIVHLNGVKLVEGLDFEYVAEGNKIVKIDVSEPWNLYGVDGQLFVIDVLRNVGEKVTMDSLADDVKQAIEAAGNIDITGKQDATDNNLATTDKTIVGAINELFQNANNGKQIIADAIGSPLSSDDTFAAMGNSINTLTTNFRNALALKGVNAPAGKFETLINKIDEIIQSGNVLNNQIMVSGEYTLTEKFGGFNSNDVNTLTVSTNLSFEPEYFIIYASGLLHEHSSSGYYWSPDYFTLTTDVPSIQPICTSYDSTTSLGRSFHLLLSYDKNSFTLTAQDGVNGTWYGKALYLPAGSVIKWYAIGSSHLPNNGGERTITPSTTDQVLPDGYYSGDITVKGDSDLKPENIVEGVEIFGVTGNARKLKYPEWYTLSTDIWLQSASSYTAADFGLTVYNNDLYMFGGSNSNNNVGTNARCFDTSSNRWITLTVLPTALTDAPVAVTIGDEIYIQGNNYLYCYSPSTNAYTTKANATRSRNDSGGATVNGKLYMISGYVPYNKINNVDMYDPTTNTWTTKTNKPTAVYCYRAVEENGKIYCAGGYLGSEFTDVMECYDPSTDSWSTLAKCPQTLVSYAAASLNGEIHVMCGGGFTTYDETNLHYIYNVANNTWATNGVVYPKGYAGAVAATAGNNIYCYGGGYSSGSSYYYTSDGYCYVPK